MHISKTCTLFKPGTNVTHCLIMFQDLIHEMNKTTLDERLDNFATR